MTGDVRADAAIDFDVDRPARGHGAEIADLAERGRDEGLAAKARIDRHDKHQIDHVDDIFDGRDRRARIERDAGLLAERADRLQRAMQMGAGFRMHRDVIAAGLGEGLKIGIGWRDHEVRVKDLLAVRADRLDDVGAIGNVGHEMPVHHVEMDPVGARRVHGADFFAQFGEIRRQDRRRDDEGTRRKLLGHVRFPKSLRGAERPRVTWGRAGGNAAADVSCGRKNLPRRAAIAGFAGPNRMQESPVLLGFSEWHGAC